jgi:hypothetical protein
MAVLILQPDLRVPIRDMAVSDMAYDSISAESFCAPALPIETTCRSWSTSLEPSIQGDRGRGPDDQGSDLRRVDPPPPPFDRPGRASPASREPGPVVTSVRALTGENVDSMVSRSANGSIGRPNSRRRRAGPFGQR